MTKITKEKLVQLQRKYNSDVQIAQQLGVSSSAVSLARKRYGIPSPYNINRPRIKKDQLLALIKQYKTDSEVGKQLGITSQAVHQRRVLFGIPSVVAAEQEKLRARILKLSEKKEPAEIAKITGLSTAHVRKKLRPRSLKPKPVKVSQTAEIIKAYQNGMKVRDLSAKYSVSTGTLYKVLKDTPRRIHDAEVSAKELAKLYKKLRSDREVANHLGIPYARAYYLRKKYQIPSSCKAKDA